MTAAPPSAKAPPGLAAALREVLRDPLAFAAALPGYQGDSSGRKQFGPLHRELVDITQKHLRVSLTVPRNHAKSTLFSQIIPAWKLIKARGRSRILLGSATLALAKFNAGEVRRILEGDIILAGLRLPIRQVFPWAAPVNKMRASGPCQSFNIAGRCGLGKEPSVFTGAPGTNLAGMRPTDIHADDITNEQNSRTRERREQGIQFIAQAEALLYDATSPFCVVSTPWAAGDSTDHLATRPGWVQFRRPLYVGPPDPTTGLRPTVCPSFISPEEAADMERTAKETGRYSFFSAQYLLEPLSSDDPLFTYEMISHSRSKGVRVADLPTKGAADFLLWDPVASVERGPAGLDRNGICVVRAVPGSLLPWSIPDPRRNVFFPIYCAEIAGGADEALRQIEDLIAAKRFPLLRSIWVEEVAAQSFLAPWARERGRIGSVTIRGQKIGGKDLMLRLSGLQTAMREGYFVFPSDCEGGTLLAKRLMEFPVSDYDDLPAAVALLSTYYERRGRLPGDEEGPPPPWHTTAGTPRRPGDGPLVL